MRLKGQVAVITGAGQGIGKAIAAAFLDQGARVVIADIVAERAERCAVELGGEGREVRSIEVDITQQAGTQTMVDYCVESFGRLDIVVNNAGISINKRMIDFELDEWEQVLRVNLTGAFLCSQAAARQMITQQSGKIINIVSLSGQRGGIGRAAYGSSKAGLELLTKVMAVELAEYGINVNAIAPGPIETEMAKQVHDSATRDAYNFLVPQGRYGKPSEIADAAVFLASDESRYVHGHTLNVDGGFLAAGLIYPLPSTR